jgi:hypothetical protein
VSIFIGLLPSISEAHAAANEPIIEDLTRQFETFNERDE